PLSAQLAAGAVLIPGVMAWASRHFTPTVAGPSRQPLHVLGAWREPRTLLIGVLVLSFAFTEGAANDWIAIALVDGYGARDTTGSLAFGLFVGAMTAGRLFGGKILDRFGRVTVLRVSIALALAGLLLVLSGGSAPLALAGALLWGGGTALGFPVGMSAAADDPARAAARVSVVSSIAYTAFLGGPPLIGVLAHGAGILHALAVVAVVLGVAVAAAGASRPLAERRC
ncbi:MAG: MFS transporter, partial [Nocardioidaceae bacterium]